MAVLLSKFRIDYSDLVVISYVNAEPKNKTKLWFDGQIRSFLQQGESGNAFFYFCTLIDLFSDQLIYRTSH
jgi:hypothetical protein